MIREATTKVVNRSGRDFVEVYMKGVFAHCALLPMTYKDKQVKLADGWDDLRYLSPGPVIRNGLEFKEHPQDVLHAGEVIEFPGHEFAYVIYPTSSLERNR